MKRNSLIVAGLLLALAVSGGVLVRRHHVLVPVRASSPQAPVTRVVPTTQPVVATVSHTITNHASVPILMYHYIRAGVDKKTDPIGYNLSVPPDEFEHQVAALQQDGYTSLHISDLAAAPLPTKPIVLTFDDGYADFYENAYPILKKYGWTATIYIITGKVGQSGYLTWDQIRELAKDGIEIGAHTVTHPDLSKLDATKQQNEIEGSYQTLEKELGSPVTAFCFPSGKYNDTTLNLVKADGFASAVTTASGIAKIGTDNPFTYPRRRMSPGISGSSLAHTLDALGH